MSSNSDGDNDLGIALTMAGLIMQVVVIFFFIAAFADYMIRYLRARGTAALTWRVKAFFDGLVTAVLFIQARCLFRVVELQDGYDGELITHEIPFIILEGVVVVIAVIALFCGHPGLALKGEHARKASGSDSESGVEPKPMSMV
jgi:ABC-type Co2+ transport system permease subunit